METPLKKLSPAVEGPELPDLEAHGWKTLVLRSVLFFLYSAGLAALFWKDIVSLHSLSSVNELFAHIPLIPLASGYLIFQEIKNNGRFTLNWGILPAIPLLAAGGATHLAALSFASSLAPQDYQAATILSVLLFWLGGVILFFGLQAFRALRFPLIFLAFMVPLPTFLENAFTAILRAGSAEAVNFLFRLSGVLFLRDGFDFHLPGLTIDIAPQCSGIRSSLALVIMSTFAGHMLLKTTRRKAIFVLCSFPVSMFKNGVRIVTLTLLTLYVDPRILFSPLHKMGGIPFFTVALVLMMVLLWILRKTEKA